ncbi:MAG: MATE family efflux transporter [Lachnospiraceae bacterium]|nr:MATE family efflux transporter [Lachnospiraceae bacterium]
MRRFRFDSAFVRHTMIIALPIMLQNGITNFVSMLDNIMVGRIGTDPMTGVSVVNSLLFVWYLCVFGGLSGIGIFTAQYCGKEDHEGVRWTFRLQLIVAAVLVILGVIVLRGGGGSLISLYLHEDGGGGDAQATLQHAISYLTVMCIGFLPFAVTQVYSTTVRSYGETIVPMVASFMAVLVNLTGNYILIFGKFGAPALGVVGAACATVLSRFVEMAYIVIWTHTHKKEMPFIRGAFSSMYIPAALAKSCAVKGTPLLLNETFWAGGQAVLTQCYSVRGLSVVSSLNISQTISNVFNVAFIAMGSATAIIIGQKLGSLGEDHKEELLSEAWRLIFFSTFLCIFSGILLFLTGTFFPKIYNTTDEIRGLASSFIRVSAVYMPMIAFLNASYFIIRSGGKTFITFLFDSVFCWAVTIPTAWILAYRTSLPILPVFIIVQGVEVIKVMIAAQLINRGIWIKDITV